MTWTFSEDEQRHGFQSARSPECKCDICVARHIRGKSPFHLDTYDTTTDEQNDFLNNWRSGPTIPKRHPSSPYDCHCGGCQNRRLSDKTPIHLKRYDDTPSVKVTRGADPGPAIGCLDRCLKCRNNTPVAIKEFRDLPLSSCTDCVERENPLVWAWDDCSACWESFCTNLNICERGICMHRWGGGLDYDNCTPAALKLLVLRRSLTDPYPDGLTLRYYYTKLLRAADHDSRFRFLDLPAELKNQVYTELLTIPYGGQTCSPQILATSRQISDDATGILYAENVLECGFHCDYGNAPNDLYGTYYTYVDCLLLANPCYEDEYGFFDRAHALVPLRERPAASILHKFTTLKINIHAGGLGDFDSHMLDGFEGRGTFKTVYWPLHRR